MKKIFVFPLIVCSLVFTSCLTTTGTSYTSSTQGSSTNSGSSTKTTTSSKSRDLILDGEKYLGEIIDEMGGITSWYCTDKYSSSDKVLLEVGYFNKYPNEGFILYDGTNEGVYHGVWHHREGLDHRWDWGADDKDGIYRYSFIIEPDGSANYFHFLEGENTAKPRQFYKAEKRKR